MMLWGEQETFKSWLVLDLGWAVATGNPWLIFKTNQHNVLIINTELPKPMYHERWKQMVLTKGTCPDNLFAVSDLGLKLDTQIGLTRLSQWVEECTPGLIIVDNLYRTFSKDLNSGEHVNRFLDTIAYIQQYRGCAFVFVHHSRKIAYDMQRRQVIRRGIEDSVGNRFLTNNAATVFEVRNFESPGANHAIEILSEKMWFEKTPPPTLRYKVDDQAQFHLI
jgi:RecA-family ATPase